MKSKKHEQGIHYDLQHSPGRPILKHDTLTFWYDLSVQSDKSCRKPET